MHPSHFTTSEKLLQAYHGEQPFHLYLKNYFSKNKKHGSRDRKEITSFCYNFFRDAASGKFLFEDELSNGVDPVMFRDSFLIQPKVFVRIRPGFLEEVRKKLAQSEMQFEWISPGCIAFESATKIDQVLNIGEEGIIQDHNSQRTGEFLKKAVLPPSPAVWDCCAGSGGKSIMSFDILRNINLTVTDRRKFIIENLRQRFEKAGITGYDAYVLDIDKEQPVLPLTKFDLVIADVPCTGSGTWARNPEQLYYFKKNQIEKYASLQKRIISNVLPAIKPGGYLLYITCSVFRKENEEVVDFIKEKSMYLVEMKLLKGYEIRADTLFGAVFTSRSA